jgi:hypothetical protein
MTRGVTSKEVLEDAAMRSVRHCKSKYRLRISTNWDDVENGGIQKKQTTDLRLDRGRKRDHNGRSHGELLWASSLYTV